MRSKTPTFAAPADRAASHAFALALSAYPDRYRMSRSVRHKAAVDAGDLLRDLLFGHGVRKSAPRDAYWGAAKAQLDLHVAQGTED